MRLSNRQPDACRRNPATLTPNGLRQAHSAADGLAASNAGCGGARLARSGPGGRRAEEERRREVIDGPLIETRRYRSCIHHQVPRMATSCVVFLDKLLSVSLPQLEGSGAAPQRSALSLRLRVGPRRHRRETKECSGKTRDQVIHEQVSMDSGTLGRQSGRDKTKGGHGCSTVPHKVPVLDKSRYYPPRKAKSLEENAKSLSLKEALELFRPDFISRSRGRVKMLEQRARRRRALQGSDPDLLRGHAEGRDGQKRNCTTPDPLSDNLFKPRERSISGREMQLRSRRIYNKLPEVTKKKKEEKKRAESQTNRLRAEVFKKKLLDQILQR